MGVSSTHPQVLASPGAASSGAAIPLLEPWQLAYLQVQASQAAHQVAMATHARPPVRKEPEPTERPREQGLQEIGHGAHSLECRSDGGALRVRWFLDARKLKGNHKVAVSPPFKVRVDYDRTATFKLMLLPTSGTERRCGTFQKAKGRARVNLKCEEDLGAVITSLRFSVAPENCSRTKQVHVNDFARNAVWAGTDAWDFLAEEASYAIVELEIAATSSTPGTTTGLVSAVST